MRSCVYVLTSLLVFVNCHGNGRQINNDEMSNQETTYVVVRSGHVAEFDCYSDGDVIVTWLKFDRKAEKWDLYVPDSTSESLFENNQVFLIKQTSDAHEGLYKCLVNDTNSFQTKEYLFQLDVVACDILARGPFPIAPLPCTETITSEAVDLTLPCTGYFGCADDTDVNIVTWFVKSDKSDDWKEARSFDSRYIQTDFLKNGDTIKGSNLTIERVTMDDFNRQFMCLLSSPQEVQGQTKILVSLRKDASMLSEDLALSSTFRGTLIVVCSLLLITSVAVCVMSVWQIYDRHRTSTKSKKTSILHADEIRSTSYV